jgi:hypothetical protein
MGPALKAFLKQALLAAEKHPVAAAGLGAAGLAGSGIVGAKMGSDATVSALPRELLKRLGLSDDTSSDILSSVEDASLYAQKHPIAAGIIGGAAGLGAHHAGASALDKIRELIGAQQGNVSTPEEFLQELQRRGR